MFFFLSKKNNFFFQSMYLLVRCLLRLEKVALAVVKFKLK